MHVYRDATVFMYNCTVHIASTLQLYHPECSHTAIVLPLVQYCIQCRHSVIVPHVTTSVSVIVPLLVGTGARYQFL